MKQIICIVLILAGSTLVAQNKNAKGSMEVDGVCMMCKSRIEKACLNTKGVKYAQWNVDTHQLSVIYDERKTNLEAIESRILAAGHDTKNAKATDEAYAKVHDCCKYREQVVHDAHDMHKE